MKMNKQMMVSAKDPAPRRFERVRVLDSGLVFEERVLKKGDQVRVEAWKAKEWVDQGRAAFCIALRSLHVGLYGDRVLNPGEEFEASEERAILLHNSGAAELVNPEQISNTQALRPPRSPSTPDLPKPFPTPSVPVKITAPKGAFFGNRMYSPGEETRIPENLAAQAVAAGVVEPIGLEGWSYRAKAYMERLLGPKNDANSAIEY